jgi:hypothetical protein
MSFHKSNKTCLALVFHGLVKKDIKGHPASSMTAKRPQLPYYFGKGQPSLAGNENSMIGSGLRKASVRKCLAFKWPLWDCVFLNKNSIKSGDFVQPNVSLSLSKLALTKSKSRVRILLPTLSHEFSHCQRPSKVGVLRASHKIFLSLTGEFE